MTREEYADKITTALNLRLDLPWLDESHEAVVIEFIVWQIVRLLGPAELDLLLDSADGLSAEEIERIATLLSTVLNRYVDIPYVPETYEGVVIQQVVTHVLSYAAKGLSLTESVA
jgi:hypothetical protein